MIVQIAGIKNKEEALECIKVNVDAIGLLVGRMHESNDFIDEKTAKEIIDSLPAFVFSVMITHLEDAEEISPSVILKLHCMDVKSLRKAYKDNEKLIDNLLQQYSTRYTTKANKSIYDLMVIALRAELQNVLYALKYEKLDTAIEHVKNISDNINLY